MIWLLQGLTASATRMPVENAVLRAFGAAMQHARAAQYIAAGAATAVQALERPGTDELPVALVLAQHHGQVATEHGGAGARGAGASRRAGAGSAAALCRRRPRDRRRLLRPRRAAAQAIRRVDAAAGRLN